MKIFTFASRNTKEIIRDPVNIGFGLGFPLVLILLLSAIQANVPVKTPQTVGERVYFQVRVLPQKYYGAQRMHIKNPAERDAWFVEKCAQFGLEVLACQAHQMSPILFTKNNKTISEPACVYAGVAVVKDIEAVNNMLRHGFGRGKAWGAGLFMTA